MEDFSQITETLIQADADKLTAQVQAALDQGFTADQILSQALIPGMDVVGERMESGEMFIPEVLMSAQAMGTVVKILKPLLDSDGGSSFGKAIIGTVKGDLHDIGKNLVSMMMESAGFEVIDLGVDIPPEQFIDAIREHNAGIVGLSALLTTTMPMMKETVDAICKSGLRENVKIIVGGAPVNQAFAEEIGADGYAADAGSASKLAKSYLN
jgi:5-methyltetrahydrofolate--homocysteine methyltransferase